MGAGRSRPGRKEAPNGHRSAGPEQPPTRPRREDRQPDRNGESRRERPARRDGAKQDRSNGSKRRETSSGSNTRQSLYVSNLPWEATKEDVHELFGRYGTVHDATIITNQRTGRSRGFGFVEMARPAADTALGALNGSTLKGRDLQVKLARPRTPRAKSRS